ncbi:hypothetical protein [Natrinema hispanicum]|nr:hypothetical protein [Natrinema hispanicum]
MKFERLTDSSPSESEQETMSVEPTTTVRIDATPDDPTDPFADL